MTENNQVKDERRWNSNEVNFLLRFIECKLKEPSTEQEEEYSLDTDIISSFMEQIEDISKYVTTLSEELARLKPSWEKMHKDLTRAKRHESRLKKMRWELIDEFNTAAMEMQDVILKIDDIVGGQNYIIRKDINDCC